MVAAGRDRAPWPGDEATPCSAFAAEEDILACYPLMSELSK